MKMKIWLLLCNLKTTDEINFIKNKSKMGITGWICPGAKIFEHEKCQKKREMPLKIKFLFAAQSLLHY